MKFEVFHPGLQGRTDVIAVDMPLYPGLWGPFFSHHAPTNNHPRYVADTSTGCVLRFLEDVQNGTAELTLEQLRGFTITTHHLDADALLPVWSLLHPQEALERRDLLEQIARCGDFFLYLDDTSAQLNFLIESLHHRLRGSGVRGERLVQDELTAECFSTLLPCWTKLMDNPAQREDLWREPLAQMNADLEYLAAPGRVTERWDAFTSLVETDHEPDSHALNSTCRNDLILTWRTDCPDRCLRVRPAIGWYEIASMPHRPHYNLAPLAARLNQMEAATGFDPLWEYQAGPMLIHAPASGLLQVQLLDTIWYWLDDEPEENMPAAYRADVREVFCHLERHASFTMHQRFAGRSRVTFRPGAPYDGLHFITRTEAARLMLPDRDSDSSTDTAVICADSDSRLRFAVSDDFYWNRRAEPLELKVSYQDSADPGSTLWVEYDGWDGAFQSTAPVTLRGDGSLQTAVFHLDRARLANGQDGADLRLCRSPGTTLVIHELRLSKVPPLAPTQQT